MCERLKMLALKPHKIIHGTVAVARVSHAEHRANIQLQRKGKQEEASFCTYLTVIATHMHTYKLEDGAGVALA